MTVMNLKTIANAAFRIPGDGGPTQQLDRFGGEPVKQLEADPTQTPTPGMDI